MLLRALAAFLALPGVIAFAVPILWLMATEHTQVVVPAALLLLALGVVGLLWCVRDFLVIGKGTLAPWDPARHLVEVGLYRVSRNPMYVAVTVLLVGWALSFGSWSLAGYAIVVAVAFHLRVVLGEEPYLARQFGEDWADYRARVPRWIGPVRHGGR